VNAAPKTVLSVALALNSKPLNNSASPSITLRNPDSLVWSACNTLNISFVRRLTIMVSVACLRSGPMLSRSSFPALAAFVKSEVVARNFRNAGSLAILSALTPPFLLSL
jgi:hypothetical protein